MGVNKVVFGAVSIMDISDSTVTAETLAKDVIAYGADGERIVGTMEAGEDVSAETAEYTTLLTELEETIDALPDGGGNETLETCTVTVSIVKAAWNEVGKYWNEGNYELRYSKMEDGEVVNAVRTLVSGEDYTIVGAQEPTVTVECVCGTPVYLFTYAGNTGVATKEVSDGIEYYQLYVQPNGSIIAGFVTPKHSGEYSVTIEY